jgi:hypothetical protein
MEGRRIEDESGPMVVAPPPWQSPFLKEAIKLIPSRERGEKSTNNCDTTSFHPFDELCEDLWAFANDAVIGDKDTSETGVCKVLEGCLSARGINNADLGLERRDDIFVNVGK